MKAFYKMFHAYQGLVIFVFTKDVIKDMSVLHEKKSIKALSLEYCTFILSRKAFKKNLIKCKLLFFFYWVFLFKYLTVFFY